MVNEVEAATEAAKAVQEVAKAGGKAIDASREAGGFFNRIFGQAIEDTVGQVWSDRIAAKRIESSIYDWERLQTLAYKTNQRLKSRGITETRSVHPKIALPLLEYATVEHEDELHTLWANLLATGLDSQAEEIHQKYITTLGEMTAQDANVLRAMFIEANKESSQKETQDSNLVYGPGVDGTYSHDEIAVITLNRLGLIEPAYIKFKTFLPGGHDHDYGDYSATQDEVILPGNLGSVVITAFGYAFSKAVGLTEEL